MSIKRFVKRSRGPTIIKDKDAILDYTVDWTAYLDLVTDTIDTVEITSDPGITVVSIVPSAKKVTIWLSGGSVGVFYSIAVRITTNNTPIARIDERTFFVEIREL